MVHFIVEAAITNENALKNRLILRTWAWNAPGPVRSEKDRTKGMLRKNLMFFHRLIAECQEDFQVLALRYI